MTPQEAARTPQDERRTHEARAALLALLYDDGCLTTPQTDHIGHILTALQADPDAARAVVALLGGEGPIAYPGQHDDCIATVPHFHDRPYRRGDWSAAPQDDRTIDVPAAASVTGDDNGFQTPQDDREARYGDDCSIGRNGDVPWCEAHSRAAYRCELAPQDDREAEVARIADRVSDALSLMTEGGEETMAPEPSDEPGSPYVNGIAAALYDAGLRSPQAPESPEPQP